MVAAAWRSSSIGVGGMGMKRLLVWLRSARRMPVACWQVVVGGVEQGTPRRGSCRASLRVPAFFCSSSHCRCLFCHSSASQSAHGPSPVATMPQSLRCEESFCARVQFLRVRAAMAGAAAGRAYATLHYSRGRRNATQQFATHTPVAGRQLQARCAAEAAACTNAIAVRRTRACRQLLRKQGRYNVARRAACQRMPVSRWQVVVVLYAGREEQLLL